MEHPAITRTLRTGYPNTEEEPLGTDFLGTEYFKGEILLIYEDEVFCKEDLSSDAIEILKYFGADEIEAGR